MYNIGGVFMLRTDRLKELRKNVRKTQKEVSELIGVASSTYSMYERGEREPDFETLDKICQLFNVSSDYLIGASDYKKKYYELNAKDEKNIEKTLEKLVEELDNGLYSKDMEEYDEESRALLINALSIGLNVAKKEAKTVKVGVNAGNHDVWDDVIKRLKEKENINVELVEFTDYVQPNQALENGDVDLNSFQTIIYLERFNKEQNTHIKPIGYTVIAPMGVYSKKIKNVSELKEGDTIAIPEDTSNNSRALRLLHAAGVIKLKDVNNTLATKDDIVENPKKIEIKELPAGQTARALDDVAASLINNGFAVEAGFQPTKDSIFIEEITDSSQPYYNVIAAKEGNENNEVYKTIVKYYQSPETAKKIEEVSKGANVPVWEKASLK